MKYNIFCKQAELRERNPNKINNLIAEQFISKHLEKTCKNELLYKTGNPIEDLLYEYFSLKGTEDEKFLLSY